MSPVIIEALAELGLDEPFPGHIEESLAVVADIDVDGRWTRMLTRARLRAKSDRVSRSVAYVMSKPGAAALEVSVAGGASLGRVVRREEHGLLVGELLLERPLSVGETAMVEYTFTFPKTGELDCEFGTYASNRLSDVSIWARFDPSRPPALAWNYTQPAGDSEVQSVMDIAGLTSLHHSLRGFGPGLMGVRWEW